MLKDKIINYKQDMQILEPCIIRDMPTEIYHSYPALSNSGITELLKCPAKYYYKYLSGEYEHKETTDFKIGKAAHCYILEGEKAFNKKYWHNPYSEFKKEELIEKLKSEYGYDCSISRFLLSDLVELVLNSEGIEEKEIHLTSSELNLIVGLSRAIKRDKRALNAFSQPGEPELSIFWQDEETGIWLKCRPDFLPYDCIDIPDYKTTASAEPESFYNKFCEYGYHTQAAMYRAGVYAITKHLLGESIEVSNFFFVAQEKNPPYISQIFNPAINIINYGDKAIKKAIYKYLECKETGIWEGYSDGIVELSLESKPDDVMANFDKENNICYASYKIDIELSKI